MWTDEQLAKEYQYCGERTEQELYRLARLGLAAEQVGQWNFQEAVYTDNGTHKALVPFLEHPAWRKP